jgi:hypothetical protein
MYKSYQFSIITNDGIITSRHYGIDDEIHEVAADLWERMQSVENENDLLSRLSAITNHYNISAAGTDESDNPKMLFSKPLPETDEISYDINGDWYADFIVIRNLTDRDWDITAINGKKDEVCLYNGEGVIFNLGGFYAGSDEDIARRKTIAELDELKENLWDSNADKNYSMLWNICAEYDNDQHDNLYLTDIIQEAEFMDEYLLEDYFQNVLAKEPNLARIRHFIGDTYDDTIYKFDGYGNLANVDKDDFTEVIDNVQDKLLEAIAPEKPIRPQSGMGGGATHANGAEM